jgi:hypothetical protein
MKKGALLLALLMAPFFGGCPRRESTYRWAQDRTSQNPTPNVPQRFILTLTWYYTNVAIDSSLHYGAKAVVASMKW